MHFLGMLWCRIVKYQVNFSQFLFNFLLKNLDTLPLLVTKKHFSSGPSSRSCRNLYREETSSNENMRRYGSVARMIARKVHSNGPGAISGAGDTPIRHSLYAGNTVHAVITCRPKVFKQSARLLVDSHDFEGLA